MAIQTRGFGVDVMPTYTPVDPRLVAGGGANAILGGISSALGVYGQNQKLKDARAMADELEATRQARIAAANARDLNQAARDEKARANAAVVAAKEAAEASAGAAKAGSEERRLPSAEAQAIAEAQNAAKYAQNQDMLKAAEAFNTGKSADIAANQYRGIAEGGRARNAAQEERANLAEIIARQRGGVYNQGRFEYLANQLPGEADTRLSQLNADAARNRMNFRLMPQQEFATEAEIRAKVQEAADREANASETARLKRDLMLAQAEQARAQAAGADPDRNYPQTLSATTGSIKQIEGGMFEDPDNPGELIKFPLAMAAASEPVDPSWSDIIKYQGSRLLGGTPTMPKSVPKKINPELANAIAEYQNLTKSRQLTSKRGIAAEIRRAAGSDAARIDRKVLTAPQQAAIDIADQDPGSTRSQQLYARIAAEQGQTTQ